MLKCQGPVDQFGTGSSCGGVVFPKQPVHQLLQRLLRLQLLQQLQIPAGQGTIRSRSDLLMHKPTNAVWSSSLSVSVPMEAPLQVHMECSHMQFKAKKFLGPVSGSRELRVNPSGSENWQSLASYAAASITKKVRAKVSFFRHSLVFRHI